MTDYHPLFVPEPEADPYPAVDLAGIVIARVVPGRSKPVAHTRRLGPDELRDAETIAKLFGSGEFVIWGMRLYQGPEGEPANSFAKGHKKSIVIGAEHGPWKAMIPPESTHVPVPANGQGVPAANAGGAAQALGMPDPGLMRDPMFMFMWMNQQREAREAADRAEQRARDDRIAQEQREREDRRAADDRAASQRHQDLLIQVLTRPTDSGLGSVVGSLVEMAKVHNPPPPPVVAPPSPQPSLSGMIADFKNLAEVAKLVKGSEEIELLKAGAQVLQGLGSINAGGGGGGGGGGLSGAPAGGG